MGNPSFVAVDWGTSSFRLWSLSGGFAVLGMRTGPYGMATLTPRNYLAVLEENLAALNIDAECPVIVCGMAGAAQGWYEAPYRDTSTDLFSLGKHAVRVPDIERCVHILPGVKQSTPANVMRGEETQLLGLLKHDVNFNGVVCLPGTHTKWVRLADGKIQRFTTCMTGELFALLSEHSVLKHSVNDTSADAHWDQPAFEQAVGEAIQAPESLAEQLFGLRASTLLENASPMGLRARLSGLLTGFELAATQPYWKDQSVAIIGEARLCNNYARALNTRQINTHIHDAEEFTLSGLINAYQHFEHRNHGA